FSAAGLVSTAGVVVVVGITGGATATTGGGATATATGGFGAAFLAPPCPTRPRRNAIPRPATAPATTTAFVLRSQARKRATIPSAALTPGSPPRTPPGGDGSGSVSGTLPKFENSNVAMFCSSRSSASIDGGRS